MLPPLFAGNVRLVSSLSLILTLMLHLMDGTVLPAVDERSASAAGLVGSRASSLEHKYPNTGGSDLQQTQDQGPRLPLSPPDPGTSVRPLGSRLTHSQTPRNMVSI